MTQSIPAWTNTLASYEGLLHAQYQRSDNVIDPAEAMNVQDLGVNIGVARQTLVFKMQTLPSGQIAYAKRPGNDNESISRMIASLEGVMREMIGDRLKELRVENVDDSGDSMNFVVLIVSAPGISREERFAVRCRAYQIIGDSPSTAVRERLTIAFE